MKTMPTINPFLGEDLNHYQNINLVCLVEIVFIYVWLAACNNNAKQKHPGCI